MGDFFCKSWPFVRSCGSAEIADRLDSAVWRARRDSNSCSQIRSLGLTVCCRILRHSISHPAIQVRDRLSLENALGDLVVQDRPNLQRRKGPRAEVLASCSRGAEEPAFLPRDRRYFRKDRDVYRRQIDG